jgi:CHAT domain-containing protein/predicted Zn-dependent protease with MMP-like domain
MSSKHRTSSVRHSLQLILLWSLALILWLSHAPLSPRQWEFRQVATAQTRDASHLMQRVEEGKQAFAYYRQFKHELQIGQMLIQQAQAYKNLGQPLKAIALLDNALQIARAYNHNALEARVLGSRGEAYKQIGDYKQAITDLHHSLKLTDTIRNSVIHTSVLKNLGTAYISLAKLNYSRAKLADELGDDRDAVLLRKKGLNYDFQALEYFKQSLDIAHKNNSKNEELNLLIYSILSAIRTHQFNLAKTKFQEALILLDKLPASQDKVYAAIELANFGISNEDVTLSLGRCSQTMTKIENLPSLQLLKKAVSIAQHLSNDHTLSFAVGHLAHFYECHNNYQQALTLTQEAQRIAENGDSKNSMYLWKWQVGRILKAQNKPNEAIKAYQSAIANLKNIRSYNVGLDVDLLENSEKIYHEYIELLVDAETVSKKNNSQNLSNILTTLEALKLVEREHYFRKNYIFIPFHKKIITVNTETTTAFLYSIILEDRLVMLMSLPNGEKHLKCIYLDKNRLRQQINEFRRSLEKRSDIIYNPQTAQNLYDWIIRPFAKDLDSLHIKTLIFINDGILRSVPMAALHDGKDFLAQKYAIATTPSLTLINTKKVNRENLRVLAVGLTKDAIVNGRTYEALTNVKQEINQVVAQIPNSKQLLDESFTYAQLQAELHKTAYPIIHIATHGEFSTVPEQTFLVTGNNDRLTMTDLDNMIVSVARHSQPVDLLVLAACETANGDNRVTLGWADIAVNTAVKSVLASLWSINDAATLTLVKKFYTEWYKNRVSKAEALRRAQQALISSGKYAHPYYWAPFVLVGNWL